MKILTLFCGCTDRLVSDLVGNPEDRFSRVTADSSTCNINCVATATLSVKTPTRPPRMVCCVSIFVKYEPPHGKTNNLHRRKQSRRSASRFYLNPKFQASSSFLRLYRPVFVGPGRKQHCLFSHEVAHIIRFIETHQKKTGFLHMRKTKTQNSCAVTVFTKHIKQYLFFLYLKLQVSVTLQPQANLCRTLSETPKTGFLTMRFI